MITKERVDASGIRDIPVTAAESQLRILYIYRGPAIRRAAGGLYIPPGDGRHVEEIAVFTGGPVMFCTYIADTPSPGDAAYSHALDTALVNVCPLRMTRRRGILGTAAEHIRNLRTLWRHVRAADALFLMMPSWPSAQAAIVAALQNKPIVSYFGTSYWHKVYFSTFRWRGWRGLVMRPLYMIATQALEGFVARRSDAVLYTGDGERWKHVRTRAVRTVPLTRLRTKDRYMRSDTCQGATITCLFVGSLLPIKGLDVLIRALARLNDNVHLSIVGPDEGRMRGDLERLASEQKVGNRIRFFDNVPEYEKLLEHYRSADLFALASLQEGFPRVIYEAMSQGLPVVATAVGGVADVVQDGVSGFIVPAGSDEALAKALSRLVTDGEARRRLIAGGYETVAPFLDKRAGEQAAGLLKWAIARPRTRRCRQPS
jgi:glycosyltransferase involved in cell wall biosynthesis